MKYKTLILSFALMALIGSSVLLASISVSPENASGLNAKREYVLTTGISKASPVQSESNITQETPAFPNAKREGI